METGRGTFAGERIGQDVMYRRNKTIMVKGTKRARTGRFRWAMPVVSLLIVAAGVYVVFMTDSFALREVTVLGSAGLPMDSLRAVTAGLVGRNMFTAPLGRIQRELMHFPAVKDVTFRRRLFHRIDCYLRERDPVALVAVDRDAGRDCMEVDSEGVIVPRRSGSDGIDLPVITGISRVEVFEEGGARKIREALEVMRHLHTFNFSPAEHLSEIHFENDEMIVILMETGATVRVGRGGYREKIRKLRAVYAALDEQERFPDMIDLRFDRQVVVR